MKKFPDLQDTNPLIKQWFENRGQFLANMRVAVGGKGLPTFEDLAKSEYLNGLTLLYEKAVEGPSTKAAFLPKPSFIVVFDRYGGKDGHYSKCITRIIVRKSIGSSLKTSFFYE